MPLTKFPRVVSFDAFGTLYTPKHSVSVQYYEIAKKFIPGLSHVPELKIVDAIREMRAQYPNYGKTAGISQELWWHQTIEKVFQGYRYDPSMVSALYDHFVDKNLYTLYPGVIPLLEFLRNRDVKLVICSNSDERLKSVLQSLQISHYFDYVYLSYNLDCSKPDPKFFDKVASDLCDKLKISRSSLLESMWHCGDDYEKDYTFATNQQITGVFVDTEHKFLKGDMWVEESTNSLVVKDLISLKSFMDRLE